MQSFTRYPAAPAPSAEDTAVSSESIDSTSTDVSGTQRPDPLGGGHPRQHGERQVHEHHVGTVLLGHVDGFLAVGRLSHDVEPGVLQSPAQALAHHGVVVCNQYSYHHAAFILIRTNVPLPGPEVISSWAPIESARSRMPTNP